MRHKLLICSDFTRAEVLRSWSLFKSTDVEEQQMEIRQLKSETLCMLRDFKLRVKICLGDMFRGRVKLSKARALLASIFAPKKSALAAEGMRQLGVMSVVSRSLHDQGSPKEVAKKYSVALFASIFTKQGNGLYLS